MVTRRQPHRDRRTTHATAVGDGGRGARDGPTGFAARLGKDRVKNNFGGRRGRTSCGGDGERWRLMDGRGRGPRDRRTDVRKETPEIDGRDDCSPAIRYTRSPPRGTVVCGRRLRTPRSGGCPSALWPTNVFVHFLTTALKIAFPRPYRNGTRGTGDRFRAEETRSPGTRRKEVIFMTLETGWKRNCFHVPREMLLVLLVLIPAVLYRCTSTIRHRFPPKIYYTTTVAAAAVLERSGNTKRKMFTL